MYIWSKEGWPTFTWSNDAFAGLLARVSREQGRLLGKMALNRIARDALEEIEAIEGVSGCAGHEAAGDF